MRDAGHLFQQWTPDSAAQKRVLIDTPAKFYDVPN
jgi:hypothetical protein